MAQNPRNAFFQQQGVSQSNVTAIVTKKEELKQLDWSFCKPPKHMPTRDVFDLKVFLMSGKDLTKLDGSSGECYGAIELLTPEQKSYGKEFIYRTKPAKTSSPVWKEEVLFKSIPKKGLGSLEISIYERGERLMGYVVLDSEMLGRFTDENAGVVFSKFLPLQQRIGSKSNPPLERLSGHIHVILGGGYLDLSLLTPTQLNPFCPITSSVSTPSSTNGPSPASSLGSPIANLTIHDEPKPTPSLQSQQSISRLHPVDRRVSGIQESDQAQKDREEEQREIEKWKTYTPEELKKKIESRGRALEEILTTERSYVSSLRTIITTFIIPLKSITGSQNKINLSPEQVNDMSNNLETIRNFHDAFLADLEAQGADVAQVFLKYADFFKMYTQYLNGYEKSIAAINNLRTHKKFQEWMTDVRSKLQKIGGLDLMSYMIMPVQRIPRYVLLLRELRRYTPPTDADYGIINDALGKIQSVASHVNEGKRQVENMTKLLDIQNRISGDFDSLIIPHRRLVREGTLTEIAVKGIFGSQRQSRRNCFLFSDILLWTTDTWKFKGTMDLTAATIHTDPKKPPEYFEISTSKTSLALQCQDEKEAKTWINEIEQTIVTLQEERDRAYQRHRVQNARSRGTNHKDQHDLHNTIISNLAKVTSTSSIDVGEGGDVTSPIGGSQLTRQGTHRGHTGNASTSSTASNGSNSGSGGSTPEPSGYKVRVVTRRRLGGSTLGGHDCCCMDGDKTKCPVHSLDAPQPGSNHNTLGREGSGPTPAYRVPSASK